MTSIVIGRAGADIKAGMAITTRDGLLVPYINADPVVPRFSQDRDAADESDFSPEIEVPEAAGCCGNVLETESCDECDDALDALAQIAEQVRINAERIITDQDLIERQKELEDELYFVREELEIRREQREQLNQKIRRPEISAFFGIDHSNGTDHTAVMVTSEHPHFGAILKLLEE